MSDTCKILKEAKTIAVVGISSNPTRTSRMIADYLHSKGYKVAGVHPAISKAGDIPAYPSLKDVPFQIDIVNVFRKYESIPELLNDILSVKPKCLWLQLGIMNDVVMEEVNDNNISGVQDRCIMVEHRSCV